MSPSHLDPTPRLAGARSAWPPFLLVCALVLGWSAAVPASDSASDGAGAARVDPGAEPVRAIVSVAPLGTFVERIGGDLVQVQPMVRPGQNPHAYEPSPRQVATLARADLYVRVGIPLEDAWLPRMRATNPGMRILDARDGIRLRPSDPSVPRPVSTVPDGDDPGDGHAHRGPGGRTDREGHAAHAGHDGHGDQPDRDGHDDADAREGHRHEALDSHVWTSPPLARSMGANIRDALIRLRPDQAARLRSNYERFAADLDALDARIRTRLAPVGNRRFLVFHPAWGYFADTYGLVQVSIEYEGKEPGARTLAGLIDFARASGVRLVLTQPQFSPRSAEQMAVAIGGRVESVDPLSADYFGTLERLADLLAEADRP